MVFNHANDVGWWHDFATMLVDSSVCMNWLSLALVFFQIVLVILGFAFQGNRCVCYIIFKA